MVQDFRREQFLLVDIPQEILAACHISLKATGARGRQWVHQNVQCAQHVCYVDSKNR